MNQSIKTEPRVDETMYRRILEADLIKVFNAHHNSSVNPYYLDRPERNRFAAEQIHATNVKRILNLGGGGHRHLYEKLSNPGINVYEVDIQGDCDLKINLDAITRLPFDSGSFEAVCAFDVLEHLENFHLVNEEMFRVASDYMLISLPNSAAELFSDVIRNRPQSIPDLDRGTFSKYYGLPLTTPSDRHRWWIYFHDVIRFYYYFALKHNASLEFWTPQLNLKKRLFVSCFGHRLYYTFFCPFVWIKISKVSRQGVAHSGATA